MAKKVNTLSKAGRLTALVLASALIVCSTNSISVHATEETKKALQEAQDKLSETQQTLEDKKDDISEMNQEKSSLQGKLKTLNEQLTEVSNNLEDIESQIDQKIEEIDQTEQELELAKQTEAEQYASMKKRVQFIYEKQNFVLIDMLLKSQSFADFLNQNDYVEQLSAYDRRMLVSYQESKAAVEAKEAKLQEEKAKLDEYRAQEQAEQSRVSGLVNQTSGSIDQYANDISDAEAQARAIEADIDSQNDDIAALKKKLEEEIRLSKLAANSKWRDISEVSFADGDRYLLANLIYCEAGGEPYEGQVAVGSVVINRVLSSVYPDSVVGVIYQGGQFSPVASGRLALALANGSATQSCYQAADAAMSGATNVGECVYFRTPIPGLSGINIGGHVFY